MRSDTGTCPSVPASRDGVRCIVLFTPASTPTTIAADLVLLVILVLLSLLLFADPRALAYARCAPCIRINDMRMQTVVADGSSNAEMWATQLKAVQQQLVDAHKQNAEALAETREHWVEERRHFLAEARKQRFVCKQFSYLFVTAE
jgi:hypothetical protein